MRLDKCLIKTKSQAFSLALSLEKNLELVLYSKGC